MPRRLFSTPRSPFARKIRIILLEKNLPFETVPVDFSGARPPALLAVSPLGKVPAFVDEDGTAVFDSTVISEYLEDRYPDPPMLGRSWAERLAQRSLDELGDTVADQAVAAWLAQMHKNPAGEERAFGTARKALAELDGRARGDNGGWPPAFGVGAAAVISGTSYFEMRHGRAMLEDHPHLLRQIAAYEARPSVSATVLSAL